MIRSFTVAALVACSVALAGSANAAVYASELKLVSADSATGQYTFSFVLNTESLFTRLIVKDSGNAEVAKVEMGAMTKGTKTFIWNGKTSGGTSVPAGTYGWAVEAEDAGVTTPLQISDDASTQTMYYSPRGVAVDANPTSDYFGRVYVGNTTVGKTASGRNVTRGIYVLDAALSDCTAQVDTAYAGGVTWATSTSSPKRLSVGPDGQVYITDWTDAHSGIWTMNPASPSSAFASLYDPTLTRNAKGLMTNGSGQAVGGSASFCYVTGTGAERAVYVADEDYIFSNGKAMGVIKHSIGTNTVINTPPTPVFENAAGLEANGDATMYPDGQSGWWHVQVRSTDSTTVPSLIHYKADQTVDYVSAAQVPPLLSPDGTAFGGNSGGGFSISKDGKLMALAANGTCRIFSVDMTGSTPVLTKLYTINPFVGTSGNQIDFDAAGNVYAVSHNSERLRVFALPSATNKFTTPARDSQKVTITPAAAVDTWNRF